MLCSARGTGAVVPLAEGPSPSAVVNSFITGFVSQQLKRSFTMELCFIKLPTERIKMKYPSTEALIFILCVLYFIYIYLLIDFCLTTKPSILVHSCDGRVSAPAVPSTVRQRCHVGQLDVHHPGWRRLCVGGAWLQSERVHDVAHFLLFQFPVLLPAAGAPEGEAQPNCGAILCS